MRKALTCFVTGRTFDEFTIVVADEIPIDNSSVPINDFTVALLKKHIWKEISYDFEGSGIGPNRLNLWKVEIPISEENKKILENPEIEYIKQTFSHKELNLKKLSPGDMFLDEGVFPDKYAPPQRHIHIIVEAPPPATTISSMHIIPDKSKIEIKIKVAKVFPRISILSIDKLTDALALIWNVETVESNPPSSQNNPCAKLKMEPSFFKINLPSTITQQFDTPIDLCLPPYESKSGMNYLNPFYDDPQFKKTVSLVNEKLKYSKDITVLAGVSGGGKTSTAFGVSMQQWTIYIDFSPDRGQYGDFLGRELEEIRARPPKYDQAEDQKKVFDMLDLGIISRGLVLIKMLALEKIKISTPKEWLFAQLRIKKIEKVTDALRALPVNDVVLLFTYIIECLGVESLILIFDEAQLLCSPQYGEYKGSSSTQTKWNLLQAYINHLTHLPVTCLIAGTYMHIASGVSLVTSITKDQGSYAHIVLKLPFLSQNDVLRNLGAVIDLTDVTPETCNYLKYVLRGRPRNCASFVRKLIISKRESTNDTKDQEMRKLIRSWFADITSDMADYLENACKYVGTNDLHPEKAIMDVLRLRVFYNQKFRHAIELLKHSIIPCISPECISISHKKTSDKNEININPSFESYLISGIEEFFLRREKTLVDVFVDNIILLNDTSSIGKEFDAVFITAIIQKHGYNVQKELNTWKNGQKFDLPSWITSAMKFNTISNLSGTVPLAKFVNDKIYYNHAIQPEIYSGSDLVFYIVDDEQNVILVSASCTVSRSPIKKKKIIGQSIKYCMEYQYMELPKKRKKPPCLQIGLFDIPKDKKRLSDISAEDEDDLKEDDMEEDDMEEDEMEEDDMEEGEMEEDAYGQNLDFGGVDYDLNYTENIKNYEISRSSVYAENHEKIKTSTENRRHIYVSVELPHRQSKERPQLFRYNEYGDLVIIVDDRNMEYVFGPAIKKLLERIGA